MRVSLAATSESIPIAELAAFATYRVTSSDVITTARLLASAGCLSADWCTSFATALLVPLSIVHVDQLQVGAVSVGLVLELYVRSVRKQLQDED